MSQTTGPTMDDPNNIPGGYGSLLTAAGGVILTAAFWIRQLWSKTGVNLSADKGWKALIEDQGAQIERGHKRYHELQVAYDDLVEVGRARAHEARESLNAAIDQIDGLRRQVSALSGQVDVLQKEIAALMSKSS